MNEETNPEDERVGTPEQIAAARARIAEAKAEGLPISAIRRLCIEVAKLSRRKITPPRNNVDRRLAKIVAEQRAVERGKVKLEEAVHRGKTEMFVTETLNFLRKDVLPRLTLRMNRPPCKGCGFQKDHKEERWALEKGVALGEQILDIYAKSVGGQKKPEGREIAVAKWPSEGAKS